MQKLIRFVAMWGCLIVGIVVFVVAVLIGHFDRANDHNTSFVLALVAIGFLWYWAGPKYYIWPWRQ